jgi:2-C-methyl-D-erythritol 4-phosphate cytidylyltransferase
VAAGSGQRLGADRPKALVQVAGRPLYGWSLAAALASDAIASVVIAAPAGFEGEFDTGVADAGESKPVTVVTGGAVRSESVLRALEAVETDLVAVHDAARPLVEPALFDQAVERLWQAPELAAVIAAAAVTDTVKRAAPLDPDAAVGGESLPLVAETLDRSQLWAVQTPQVFRSEVLRRALRTADSLAAATDDAMLVEALGERVALLPWSPRNFKVTTPEDLARAVSILGP